MSLRVYPDYYTKFGPPSVHEDHYKNYYVNQAGSGISGYEGTRYQRGSGFFGNIFRSAILPLLKYLGKKAASTGVQVASDALSGQNVLESLKSRGKEAAGGLVDDAAVRATKFIQTGKGSRKRKLPLKSKKNTKTIKKRKVKSTPRKRSVNKDFMLF